MKIAWPDYNKSHRCPGWSGAGWSSYNPTDCEDGYIHLIGRGVESPWWQFYPGRCSTCGLVVLPWNARYVDPAHWWHSVWWRVHSRRHYGSDWFSLSFREWRFLTRARWKERLSPSKVDA